MTRFFIPLERVAKFVIDRIGDMVPGEIYIPKMPSAHISMIAEIFVEEFYKNHESNTVKRIIEIGIRPGEKIHETLITKEEAKMVFHDGIDGYFKIISQQLTKESFFEYKSDTNPEWLSGEDIKGLIANIYA